VFCRRRARGHVREEHQQGIPLHGHGSQRVRAWLWAGSAAESLDLHTFVGGDWTASAVYRAHVHGDRLLLLGTVERLQKSGGYRMLMAEQTCWWEYRL
jgi:hypothetical protein